MSKYGLPHKANDGEIIRVRGHEDKLFLVSEWTEEITHEGEFEEPCVTYTCIDIDDRKNIKIVFDEDVLSIAVTADKVDDFLAKRTSADGSYQELTERDEEPQWHMPQLQIDISALMKQFNVYKEEKQGKQKKRDISPWEQERIRAHEKKMYIDYLIDRYVDLSSLQCVLGHDETRAEEMTLIREEFHINSIALYGEHQRKEER